MKTLSSLPYLLALSLALATSNGRAQDGTFSNVTATVFAGLPQLNNSSVAWGDYDNDGLLDLLLTGNLTGRTVYYRSSYISQLWLNTGGGFNNVTASVAPALPGVEESSVAWADYDNDGRLDFLLTGFHFLSQLWWNTTGGFSNVTATVAPDLPGVAFSSVAWGDYDNDGRLDFLLTGGRAGAFSQLWRNTGSGFSNVTASVAPGLPGVGYSSVAWGDYDNDRRTDFLITGFSSTGAVAQLWRNAGGGFSNVTASVAPGLPGVALSSVAWGDYDNDGRLDFLLTGYDGTNCISQLWRNTGSGFTNVTAGVASGLPGVCVSSVAWGDYDNDGRLDFLLSGDGPTPLSQLWRNTGSGFSNVTANVAPGLPGVDSGSVAWGDYDNDGRLDFLLTGYDGTNSISQLWRNDVSDTNSPPAAPTGLSVTVSGDTVTLNWNAPLDDWTPAAGLNYNVRVGTTPGASDVLSPMALANGLRLLPARGNAQSTTKVLCCLPPGRAYYWSVQAVDTSFAGSSFATELQFGTPPILSQAVMLDNGHFRFSLTNESDAIYDVLGTTDVSLPVTQWEVLGQPTAVGGGLYQFTDALAPNHAQRFYLLRAQ